MLQQEETKQTHKKEHYGTGDIKDLTKDEIALMVTHRRKVFMSYASVHSQMAL